jgi:SH3-like domain-containing protein
MLGAAPTARHFVIAAGLCLATLSTAMAQSMVSVRGNTLNMRSGPGTQHEVQWELKKGYPLQIVKRQRSWLQVKDFEGDTGWVSRSLTSGIPHHIVKRPTANVRSGPGTQYRIVGKASYGEVLRTRDKQGRWVKVERTGAPNGWIAKSLLWGW